jgi:hypothetical protein
MGMARTFSGKVAFEIIVNGTSLECIADVEFTATPPVAATWDDPAEGGEVEVLLVEGIWTEQVEETKLPDGTIKRGIRRVDFTDPTPKWLEDFICEQANGEDLLEHAGTARP